MDELQTNSEQLAPDYGHRTSGGHPPQGEASRSGHLTIGSRTTAYSVGSHRRGLRGAGLNVFRCAATTVYADCPFHERGKLRVPAIRGFPMATSTLKSYRRVLTEHRDGQWVMASDQHRRADREKAGIRVAQPDSQDSYACESVSGATPPAIASLIENAAASFELDPNASREYLFRAISLLRAQTP